MTHATPCVSFAVGDAARILDGGRSGMLACPGDMQGLARAVADLLEAPAKRRELGLAGKARVASHYSLRRMCSDYFWLDQELGCTLPS